MKVVIAESFTRYVLPEEVPEEVLNEFYFQIYTNVMRPWIQFGVDIKVPSVTKTSVKLIMAHPLETILLELQRFIKAHTADVTTKSFIEQNLSKHGTVYVPFDSRQYTTNSILIGRNFEQWKASSDLNSLTNVDHLEPKSNKLLQKFSPFYENDLIITRQRLLFISVTCQMVSLKHPLCFLNPFFAGI